MGRMTDGKDAHRCDPVCFVRGPSGIEFHPKVNIHGNGRYIQVEFVPDLPVTEGIYEVWITPNKTINQAIFYGNQNDTGLDTFAWIKDLQFRLCKEWVEEVEEAFCAEG